MPSMKHIKRRISSVRSTKQITKAMDLVAASKLQKIKQRLGASRLMLEQAARMIDEVKTHKGAQGNVFAGQGRTVKSSAYLVLTSNRGLCGGYNSNIVKAALAHMEEGGGKNEKVIAFGARGLSYLRRRGKNILHSDTSIAEAAHYEDAQAVGRKLIGLYLAGEIDEVYVAYTHFESTLAHQPRVMKILPIELSPQDEWESTVVPMRYEPELASFLAAAVPEYISMLIYGAMVESNACEQAARMMSMNAATQNAEDIIDDLTLMYNRQRQSFITQEINEIVSGASSLR